MITTSQHQTRLHMPTPGKHLTSTAPDTNVLCFFGLCSLQKRIVILSSNARPFTGLFGTKGGVVGRYRKQVCAQLLADDLLLWVFQKCHGQFFLTQQHGVVVVDLAATGGVTRCVILDLVIAGVPLKMLTTHLVRHCRSKLIELLLPNDAGVAKPSAIRLDAGAGKCL